MDQYSNREIDLMLNSLKDHIDVNHGVLLTTLKRIEDQTTKTNGRVKKLEIWRGMIIGAIAIISMIVIPLTVYAFNLAIKVQ